MNNKIYKKYKQTNKQNYMIKYFYSNKLIQSPH